MSYIKKLKISRISPDIDEVRLVSWVVQEGAAFKAGDILLEVETDKSVVEVPAEEDGTLLRHLAAVGEAVDFDALVAEVEVEGEAPAPEPSEQAAARGEPAPAEPVIPAAAGLVATAPVAPAAADAPAASSSVPGTACDPDPAQRQAGRMLATPAARRLAADARTALEGIVGTGPNGRITRSDVLAAGPSSGTAPGASAWPDGQSVRAATRQGELHYRTWAPRPKDALAMAPTVVLLHGIFGDVDTWAVTMSGLRKAGLRGLAVDLPCHGASACTADSVAATVDAVAELLDRQVPGPVALIGHSFGSGVAARLATRLSARLHSLILIAPTGLGTEINQSFLDGVMHARTREGLARELEKLTASPVPMSDVYLDQLAGRLRQRHQELQALCASFSHQGVQQIDVRRDVARLDVPVAILHGRHDAIIPWQHVLNVDPRAELHLLPGAGHMPHWESPALALDVMVEVLKR